MTEIRPQIIPSPSTEDKKGLCRGLLQLYSVMSQAQGQTFGLTWPLPRTPTRTHGSGRVGSTPVWPQSVREGRGRPQHT